jgi:hypothetical protein
MKNVGNPGVSADDMRQPEIVTSITNSERSRDFAYFALAVVRHIDEYTVPQYGDRPHDPVESWDAQQCMDCITRYVNRFGRNVRGKEEAKRDLLKIAHYAQLAYDRL